MKKPTKQPLAKIETKKIPADQAIKANDPKSAGAKNNSPNKNKHVEFLPGIQEILQQPLPWHVWGLPTLIILFVFTMVLWASVSEITVVVSARGEVVPEHDLQLIQPRDSGVIKDILVETGQKIEKNQLLVSLDTTKSEAELRKVIIELEEQYAIEYKLSILKAKLDNQPLLSEDNADTKSASYQKYKVLANKEWQKYENEMQLLEQKIKVQVIAWRHLLVEEKKTNALIPFAKKKYNRKNKLYHLDNMLAKQEVEEAEQQWVELKYQLLLQQQKIRKASSEVALARKERLMQKLKFSEELVLKQNENQLKIASLEEQKKILQNNLQAGDIRSPFNGIIHDIKINTIGSVVKSGDILMQVIPQETRMFVNAKLLNKDIGFVEKGMKVKVKLDSFNFTKYGAISAEVIKIAKATIKDEQLGEVYPIKIALKQNHILVDGEKTLILPGMTTSVDIKIGNRHLIDYIISPFLRYKDEALRER